MRVSRIAALGAIACVLGLSLNTVGLAQISYVPMSNDADCGITSSRSYTHKLDFGTGAPGATINGVAFSAYNTGANGTLNFVATWTFSGVLALSGNANHNVSGDLINLMHDMYIDQNNTAGGTATWTLNGLTAGVTYDARIYTRAYGGSAGTRNVTLVFDPDGAGAISDSTGQINEDDATQTPPGLSAFNDAYYINYRFTAVTGEDLVIAATQHAYNASWHIYGISCEQAGPAATDLSLVNSAIGVSTNAKLLIAFDEDILEGTGDIRIRRIDDDSVVEAIDVETAAVTIDGAEATVHPTTSLLATETDYYVEIDGGAFTNVSGVDCYAVTGNSLLTFSTPAAAITVVPMSNDTDCDISTDKEYTHALDFGTGTPGALINGVQFNAYNGAANGSLNFSYAVSSGNPLAYSSGNNPPNITGNLFNLMKDMYINQTSAAGGTTTWTLSGLEAGILYDTRIYVRQWGVTSGRIATMVFDPDGAGPISDSTGVISEDEATSVGMPTDASAYYISYAFRGVAGEDLVITATQYTEEASWHLYGLTCEVVPPRGTLVTIR